MPTGPSRSEVPTVNAIGLDALGQHCSTCVDVFVKHTQSNAADSPVSNTTLDILSHTTEYGTPMTPGPYLRTAIHNFRDTVTLK